MSRRVVSQQSAKEILWRRADLSWLLDVNQLELYKVYKNNPSKIMVWNCCRGMGKSFLLAAIATEECLKKPNVLVKYTCPTQDMARRIVQPNFVRLLADCPEDIKPEYKVNEHAYVFPNGSKIELAGLDKDGAEKIRGGSAVLAIVDEAGMVDVRKTEKDEGLNYIVDSILYPAVTRSKEIDGKIILASTPPKKASHPFVRFMQMAERTGSLSTRIIYECPRYTKEQIQGLISQYGGVNSVTFRREYLCEIVRSNDIAVIPEFTKEIEQLTVKPWPRPKFFHRYVSMDFGNRDFTVVLFGYFDFLANKLIIEDEIVMTGSFTTVALANNIQLKEQELYYDPYSDDILKPYRRVADNTISVLNDLSQLHKLYFEPTKKDDKETAINFARIMIQSQQVIIHPRCKTLVRHLREATWIKNKTGSKREFARDVDNGHYDAVDALVYLIRNIDYNVNPFPPGYGRPNAENHFFNNKSNDTQLAYAVKQILNIKKR